MLLKRTLLGASVALTAMLTACGGGATAGGASNSLMTNSVVAGTTALKAGQSTSIAAHAVMRGATPSEMTWTAAPLAAMSAGDPTVLISDMTCASATLVAPPIPAASGEGVCNAILTIPPNAPSGVWRVTNTATSPTGSVSNYVDVMIAALPASGVMLVESSTPVTGYAGKSLSLNLPFTSNSGATVSDVKYKWTAALENPSTVAIAGSKNSTATVIPVIAGQYRFDAEVTAKVNGITESQTGSVVAVVYPATFVDVIDAGMVQITAPGNSVSLSGAILNRDDTLVYSTTWSQLAGAAGGPVRVTLANTNTTAASFIAPTTLGTYGFEFKVVKNQPDGTQAITTGQTTVLVQANASGVFNVTAGDAQTVVVGAPTLLRGSVGTQGNTTGVTYLYQWSQVGAAPAAVTLSNANATTASFIPSVAGTYTFNLTVTASSSAGVSSVSGTTQVMATTATAATATFALSANAGPAQSVAPNSVTSLTGSQVSQGTTSGVTYAYAWTQIGATPAAVTLSSSTSTTATFMPTVAGVYQFQLTVTATLTDGTTRTATSTTQVIVGGVGNTFTASAGDAQVTGVNTAVTMAGVVTTQGTFSGATFSYAWTQIGASPAAVLVSNATSLTASFAPTVAGTYTFELTVTAVQGGVTSMQTAQTQVLVTP